MRWEDNNVFLGAWLFSTLALCVLVFIVFSVAWAVLIIWALNVLGLHVAYGAAEVIAVLILSGITFRVR